MKIALTNLCKTEDFAKHERYNEAFDYLQEENIEYIDLATGADTINVMTQNFNKSLETDTDLVWVIRGGLTCIETLEKIDWNRVISSKKKYLGLSDFTHFSTMAVAKGGEAYYGVSFTKVKYFFPTKEKRKFITNFLKTGKNKTEKAIPLFGTEEKLDLENKKIIGGHLGIFTFMQSLLNIDLKNRYLFIEYHHSAIGENLDDLKYYLEHLLYIIKDNLPKGFILGKTYMKNFDGTDIPLEAINNTLIDLLKKYDLPIYYIDHFENILKFS